MVKSAPSGMLGEEMSNRMGAVRNDAVRGPSAGQATLRRLLGGDPIPDRVSTHVVFGKIEPRPGSVTARMASPVQNFYFQNPTEGELCFSLKLSRDNEGQRTPEDSGCSIRQSSWE